VGCVDESATGSVNFFLIVAIHRIGGPSQGADRMVEVARSLGKTVFHDIAAIPDAS
jgi:hypothetical protein